MDAQGKPIPWMPYWITQMLDNRLKSHMRLFEYGSGASTNFYAARVHSVTSIEHDKSWQEAVAAHIPSNATVTLCAPPEDYPLAINKSDNQYHVVIIDGIHRNECMAACMSHITPDGVVILDDSNRPNYAPCFQTAARYGFRNLSLLGHKPGSIRLHQSSIFYRDANCLGL